MTTPLISTLTDRGLLRIYPSAVPTLPGAGAFLSAVEALSPVALWPLNDTTGGNFAELVGGFNGTWLSGTRYLSQPTLVNSDTAGFSTGMVGDARGRITHQASHVVSAGGAMIVFQLQNNSDFMTIVARGLATAGSRAGTWEIVSKNGGVPSGSLRNSSDTKIELDGSSGAVTPNVPHAMALTWGAAGLKLYLDTGTPIATDATTDGAAGTSEISLGAWHGNTGYVKGLLGWLILFGSQPTDGNIGTLMGYLKSAGVTKANTETATATVGQSVTINVLANDFYPTGTPTLAIASQPSLGSLSVQPGNVIRFTAGQSTGAAVGGSYTLNGSSTAALNLTVTAAAATGNYFLNPWNADSALHRPIGTGAVYADDSHPSTQQIIRHQGKGTLNHVYPNGHMAILENDNDPLYTITSTGSGVGLPTSVRLPADWPPGWNATNSASGDRAVSIINAVTWQTKDFYHFNRNNQTADFQKSVDLTGLGHGTAINQRPGSAAAGPSSFWGAVRSHEILAAGAPIQHAHGLVVTRFDTHFAALLGMQIQWPATAGDTTASTVPGHNQGPLPYGALLAIPPSVNLDNLSPALSEPGRRLFQSMQDYGVYVIDGGGQWNLRCDGTVPNSTFEALRADFRAHMWRLRLVLNSVSGATAACIKTTNGQFATNNGFIGTPSYPAGGGNPRAINNAIGASSNQSAQTFFYKTPPPLPTNTGQIRVVTLSQGTNNVTPTHNVNDVILAVIPAGGWEGQVIWEDDLKCPVVFVGGRITPSASTLKTPEAGGAARGGWGIMFRLRFQTNVQYAVGGQTYRPFAWFSNLHWDNTVNNAEWGDVFRIGSNHASDSDKGADLYIQKWKSDGPAIGFFTATGGDNSPHSDIYQGNQAWLWRLYVSQATWRWTGQNWFFSPGDGSGTYRVGQIASFREVVHYSEPRHAWDTSTSDVDVFKTFKAGKYDLDAGLYFAVRSDGDTYIAPNAAITSPTSCFAPTTGVGLTGTQFTFSQAAAGGHPAPLYAGNIFYDTPAAEPITASDVGDSQRITTAAALQAFWPSGTA